MADSKWASEFIYLFGHHDMAEEMMSLYNARMSEKWPSAEKFIDRISDPIPAINNGGLMKHTDYCYWVHVTVQSDDATEQARNECEWKMPEEYNNILEYDTQRDKWGLRFMCILHG